MAAEDGPPGILKPTGDRVRFKESGDMGITTAVREDLPRILEIQKRAFLAEAVSLGDFSIEPLRQTLESVENDLATSLILKAVSPDGGILGSVRGKSGEEGVYVFKLSVDPPAQGRGLGEALLRSLEEALPASRYWLFTSTKNRPAIALYSRLGYSAFKERDFSATLRVVYFEKLVPARIPPAPD
ncbi:MAG: GNAT family N-acetyltransferase [Deltaproteobacteria bacterium]|jgi:ribosomal protein S18 acetylase RimI-like enzyme|nr:GNAT family N-acetyltransferase [Deltaproteobacteria bacterium]